MDNHYLVRLVRLEIGVVTFHAQMGPTRYVMKCYTNYQTTVSMVEPLTMFPASLDWKPSVCEGLPHDE
jgi:hypothetical protein